MEEITENVEEITENVRVRAKRALGLWGTRIEPGGDCDMDRATAESYGDRFVEPLGPATGEPPMTAARRRALAEEAKKKMKETPRDKQAAPPADKQAKPPRTK